MLAGTLQQTYDQKISEHGEISSFLITSLYSQPRLMLNWLQEAKVMWLHHVLAPQTLYQFRRPQRQSVPYH